MFNFLVTILSIWLFIGSIKLALKIAWGTTKIIASILLTLGAPILLICIIFSGGPSVVLPALLIAGAFGLLKKGS